MAIIQAGPPPAVAAAAEASLAAAPLGGQSLSPSRFELFCDGLIEAGWLAALIVAPLLFNLYALRVFENATTIRAIATMMAAAGLAKVVARAGAWAAPRRLLPALARPAPLAIGAFLAAQMLATLLSVSRAASWWGSYERRQGLFTLLAYLVIFGAVATCLRQRDQLERFAGTVVLTSVPISLYAAVQRLHSDPLRWTVDPSFRVISTLGNPDFLAGYLILVIPLTAYCALQAMRAVRAGSDIARARLTLFGSALILQGFALAWSGGRGAELGFVAAAALSLAVMSAMRWGRIATSLALGLLLLGGAGLVLLNVDGGPLQPLRNAPLLSRFSHTLDESDGSSRVRLLLWQGAIKLALPHPALSDAAGQPDLLNWLRPVVGYGPETTGVTFNDFTSADFGHFERPFKTWDRAHNRIFDLLITSGLAGAAAYLALIAALVYAALRRLLGPARSRGRMFALLAAGGAVLGGLLSLLSGGVFLGLGVPVGLLAGICAYVLLCATGASSRAPRRLLTMALLTALVGHFVEAQFGFDVTPTSVYFWAYAGLLLALPRLRTPEYPVLHPVGPPPLTRAVIAASITTMAGVVLSYDFLTVGPARSLGAALWTSLTTLYQTGQGVSYGVLAMLLATWLTGALLWAGDRRSASIVLVAPPIIWLGFAFTHLWLLRGSPILVDSHSIAGRALGQTEPYSLLLLALLILGIMLASALALACWRPGLQWRIAQATAAIVLLAGTLAANTGSVNPARADVLLRLGKSVEPSWQVALPIYEQAVALAPFEPATHLTLGQASLIAAQSGPQANRPASLERAHTELAAAVRLNPLDPLPNVFLAHVAQQRESTAAAPPGAKDWQAAADRYLATAVRLDPNRPWRWTEWAAFAAREQGDYDAALARMERAFALDPELETTFDAMDGLTPSLGDAAQAAAFRTALQRYEDRTAAAPDRLARLLVIASAHNTLKDWPAAIASYQSALSTRFAAVNTWAIHRALSASYAGLGDYNKARSEMDQALRTARPAERGALTDSSLTHQA